MSQQLLRGFTNKYRKSEIQQRAKAEILEKVICIQKARMAKRESDNNELLEKTALLEKNSKDLENTATIYAQKYHQLHEAINEYSKHNNVYANLMGGTDCNWKGPHFGHDGGEGPMY